MSNTVTMIIQLQSYHTSGRNARILTYFMMWVDELYYVFRQELLHSSNKVPSENGQLFMLTVID